MSKPTLAMLQALAEQRGCTVEELVADLLRAESRSEDVPRERALSRRGDRSIRRRDDEDDDEQPSRWNDAEVAERWLEEERRDPQGVLGPGGMKAGGIFGDGAVATDSYDPDAMIRGEHRALGQLNAHVQSRTLDMLDRMDQRLERLEARDKKQLPPAAPRRALPRKR